ncbi:MAG: hypothetical protein Q8O34_12035 [Rhodocyclaceae bacterium]|nr:hypothetical protein [Rhodocyclaceae bacterium]
MFARLRPNPANDWTAVVLSGSRMDVARVRRSAEGRPEVLAMNSFERGADDLAALRALRRSQGLAGARCTTLLRHGEYQVIQADTPRVPPEERREALRWQVKDLFEFPVETATLDVLEIPQAAAGKPPQCWVVAANNAVLQPKIHLFQDAKVPLAAVDIPEFCQRNIAALFEEQNRALAVLAFADDGGLLSFTYQGELYVSRHIDITLSQLESAPAERREALFERIALDVQRSLDNFDRTYSAISLTRLLVSPVPGADGLVDYLRANVAAPVAQLDLGEVMDLRHVPELAEPERQARVLRALGAALRDD